jgi:hypothetical protein
MLIYRFRVTSEDYDDFLRVIEIQPSQTFHDFHTIIMTSAEIDKCDKAFFYITDNIFKKQKEISLKPLKKQVRKYDDELDEIVTEIFIPHLMKDSKLKDYVEDPHQRMIYEFHGKEFIVLFIELFKIIKTDEVISLPRCIQSKGEIPKKLDISVIPVTAPPEEAAAIHPPLVAPGGISLFSSIQEDESEIAEIENQLGELLAAEENETPEDKTIPSQDDEATYSMHQEEDTEGQETDHIESLDEYEDIENLEINHRDFDRDSDE